MTGVVLAGGRSTRFGRDKLLEPVDGEPLLWRPVRALAGFCAEVIVATAPGRRYPPPPHLSVPIRHAEDEREGGGPAAGVRAALDIAACPVALVVGGDMPSLEPRDMERLVATVAAGRRAGSFGQPLPCAVDSASARDALARRRLRSLRELLAWLDVVTLVDPLPATLRDVDVPGDLPERGSDPS